MPASSTEATKPDASTCTESDSKLAQCTVSELKANIAKLGLSSSRCLEKADLVALLRSVETPENKSFGRRSSLSLSARWKSSVAPSPMGRKSLLRVLHRAKRQPPGPGAGGRHERQEEQLRGLARVRRPMTTVRWAFQGPRCKRCLGKNARSWSSSAGERWPAWRTRTSARSGCKPRPPGLSGGWLQPGTECCRLSRTGHHPRIHRATSADRLTTTANRLDNQLSNRPAQSPSPSCRSCRRHWRQQRQRRCR